MIGLDLTPLDALVRIAEAVAAVITVLVGLRAKNHAKTAAGEATRAREQVENDHDTNLRDDLDRMHNDVREGMRYLAGELASANRRISEVRTDLTDANRRHDEALGELRSELAGPTKPKPQRRRR